MYLTCSTLLGSGFALRDVTALGAVLPDGLDLELLCDPAVTLAEPLLVKEGEILRVAMRVAGERQHVGKRALAAALVADDGNHVEIERQLAVEPDVGDVGVRGLADMRDARDSAWCCCRTSSIFGGMRPI